MTLTVADFDNAKTDLKTVSAVSNSRDPETSAAIDEYQTRLGDDIDTLVGRLKRIGYLPPIAYAAAISFTITDNVKTIDRSGIIYAPKPSELPFTTSGTWGGDDEDKFFVIQGVVDADMSDYVFARFATANDLVAGSSVNLGSVTFSDILGRQVETEINNTSSNAGGNKYLITTSNPGHLSTLISGIYQGVNHDLGGGFYAKAVVDNGYLDVEVGGVAESSADNNNALTSCASFCNSVRGTMVLPPYKVPTSPLDFNSYLSMRHITGSGQGTGLIAVTGTYPAMTALLSWQQIAGRQISNFELDCNNQTDVGVNTDWTGAAGPSLSNRYSYVWISGYKNTGWKALNNNDSPFEQIVIRQKGASAIADSIGIDIDGTGGFVSIIDCNLADGKLKWGAQNLNLVGGFQWGVECAYNSFNDINIDGAYIYSGNIGACVKSSGSAYIGSVVANSCHMILENTGDFLVDGTFDTGFHMSGGHITFSDNHSGTKEIFGSSLTGRDGGRNPLMEFTKVTADEPILNDSGFSNVAFEYDNFYLGGGNVANRRMAFFAYDNSENIGVGGGDTDYVNVWNTELYDYGDWYNNGSGIATAKIGGQYTISAARDVSGVDGTNTRIDWIVQVGSDRYVIDRSHDGLANASGEIWLDGAITINVNLGDQVRIILNCSGDPIDVGGDQDKNYFSMTRA